MKYEFMDKARENLAAAEICFENDLFNASANRAYYAAFQAAVSALADRGIKKEKLNHQWVQAEFNSKLISRRKVYSGKVKPYLMKMQTVRNEADYDSQKISKKVARRQLSRAREMLNMIRKELGT